MSSETFLSIDGHVSLPKPGSMTSYERCGKVATARASVVLRSQSGVRPVHDPPPGGCSAACPSGSRSPFPWGARAEQCAYLCSRDSSGAILVRVTTTAAITGLWSRTVCATGAAGRFDRRIRPHSQSSARVRPATSDPAAYSLHHLDRKVLVCLQHTNVAG